MKSLIRVAKIFAGLLCLVMPSGLCRVALRVAGHKVAASVRIGFSVVIADQIYLQEGCRIGHFNFIHCRRLLLRKKSYLGNANLIRGPISVQLSETAAIGNRNEVVRASWPVSYGPARLKLGKFSKITAGHKVDCTCSILIGDYSTVAGAGSQIWTHGYFHYPTGPDRYRIDGGIRIGNNVYIGAGSVVNAGVTIGDAITVGGHSSVARSLIEPGLYVSQPLRYIQTTAIENLGKLELVPTQNPAERVYRKKKIVER